MSSAPGYMRYIIYERLLLVKCITTPGTMLRVRTYIHPSSTPITKALSPCSMFPCTRPNSAADVTMAIHCFSLPVRSSRRRSMAPRNTISSAIGTSTPIAMNPMSLCIMPLNICLYISGSCNPVASSAAVSGMEEPMVRHITQNNVNHGRVLRYMLLSGAHLRHPYSAIVIMLAAIVDTMFTIGVMALV